jgi:hypothetical protein
MNSRPSQHAGLSVDRWKQFSLAQQIVMIANELNRGRRFLNQSDPGHLKATCERILRLVDLTVEANASLNLRRELLRWREVIAQFYLAETPPAELYRAAEKALVLLNHEAARLLGPCARHR